MDRWRERFEVAKQVEAFDATTPDGTRVRVAVLDNNAVRVTVKKRRTAVTWHAASRDPNDDSITIITPTGELR
jgi:CYTH domain-containing protein